jgi:hypothetical protein
MKFEVLYHLDSDLHPGEIHGPFLELLEAADEAQARAMIVKNRQGAIIEQIKPAGGSGRAFESRSIGPRHPPSRSR